MVICPDNWGHITIDREKHPRLKEMTRKMNERYSFLPKGPAAIALCTALGGLVILSGCGAPPESVTPGGSKGGAIKKAPAAASQLKKKDPPVGIKIATADEILQAAKNPFMSKLPKIELPTQPEGTPTEGGAQADAPPQTDPFEKVSLSGVVYKPGNAIALLAIAGGDTDSGSATRMVRRGEILTLGGGEVKVIDIQRDAVTLASTSDPKNVRNLLLPSIIGFGKSGSESSGSAETTSSSESGARMSAATSAAAQETMKAVDKVIKELSE